MHSKQNYSLYRANYTIIEIWFSHGMMSILSATRTTKIYTLGRMGELLQKRFGTIGNITGNKPSASDTYR